MDYLDVYLANKLLQLLDCLIAILCIATIGYIIYCCICIMFLQKEDHVQRIALGYFTFILLRIFSVMTKAGIIE